MDPDQDLLDAYEVRENARKMAKWELETASKRRYESAAKHAHNYRRVILLLNPTLKNPSWKELDNLGRSHLITEAKIVAEKPSITAAELLVLYRERLIASGDTDNSDLGPDNESTPIYRIIEGQVLERLKEYLADSSNPPPEYVLDEI